MKQLKFKLSSKVFDQLAVAGVDAVGVDAHNLDGRKVGAGLPPSGSSSWVGDFSYYNPYTLPKYLQ